jgi:hypothetical protein
MVHPNYPHQDPSIMLPDIDLQEPLTPEQLELVKQADVFGAMAQVCVLRLLVGWHRGTGSPTMLSSSMLGERGRGR